MDTSISSILEWFSRWIIKLNLDPSNWISLVQSFILIITIILIILQYRQSSKHHREDIKKLHQTFLSQVHERVLSNLLSLNRIMLEFPNEIKQAFHDLKHVKEEKVRIYCYVYAILDLLNYMVLHLNVIDPYIEKHLKNLAKLLYTETTLNQVFEDAKEDQSDTLIQYLETKIKPIALIEKRDIE